LRPDGHGGRERQNAVLVLLDRLKTGSRSRDRQALEASRPGVALWSRHVRDLALLGLPAGDKAALRAWESFPGLLVPFRALGALHGDS